MKKFNHLLLKNVEIWFAVNNLKFLKFKASNNTIYLLGLRLKNLLDTTAS